MHIPSRLMLGALLLAGAVGTDPAQACGEVMYRMGGALRYQAFVSRHPAQILLYGDSAVAQARGLDRDGFRRSLEKAGHKITVAEDPAALEQALAAHAYDIVIASADDLSAVQAALAQATRGPALIPVLDRANEATLRRQYPQALTASAGLNRFLKTIERTMETRGS
ncbi:MAG: hypothetical protein GXC76_06600 [Rhodanobacteraceae bacterium]|nr:hypothetical protein [Rhodanobacteraceae bacterium]